MTELIISMLRRLIPEPKIALTYSNPWELFVAVVLSAQTTDKKVNEVTQTLFKKYPSFQDYLKATPEQFAQDIRQIGLNRGKAKNILASAKIINNDYGGEIPDTMDDLIKLPGVGRKTANILLSNIYDKQVGIAVDTHVKRLSNLWGLSKESDPNKIEKDLMEIVPKREWKEFSYLLIAYGRTYCKAFCKHVECPLRSFIPTNQGV